MGILSIIQGVPILLMYNRQTSKNAPGKVYDEKKKLKHRKVESETL
jgi:hypothetical protein